MRAERSNDWYWGLGIIAVCGTVAAIFFGNLLFAAIIALAAVILGMVALREPREYDVEINERGVLIDNELYPYRSIHSFWIDDREHRAAPKLFLITAGIMHPHVAVLVAPPADADSVRDYLRRYVAETKEEHTFSTMFADFLGL